MAVRSCKREVGAFAAMAAVEFATVGVNTVYKAATLKGLSYFVFVAYTYVIGTLVLLPLPFVFRRCELPSFKQSFFYRMALLALLGLSSNLCAYIGIEYSSPILASAVSNLTPAFTYILAIIFRMEKLEMRSSTTHIKIIGTIVSISGALIAVLFKGPIVLSSTSSPSLSLLLKPLATSETNWVLGGILLASQYLLSSIWYIVQTQVMGIYPDAKVVVPIYFILTSIIAVPICFLGEENLSAWALRMDITLVSVVLSGFFGSLFSTFVHTWGLHLKGPLYVSIFRPFSIAIAAAVGVIFLGDSLYLGSVIGAIILLLGFYAVICGKAQEEEENNTIECDESDNIRESLDGQTPLLQSYRVEESANKRPR